MFDSLVDGFSTAFPAVQTEIYTRIVPPVLFATGPMSLSGDAFDGVPLLLIGALQIVLMRVLLRRPNASDSTSRTDGAGRTESA
ncbi:hypothetical protein [Pandoraea bronchicola]|uniref:Fatty acid hydroxylase n=1 Tax=Pandoraea bronchicola TaxID=2508287 RepID=A0A5E5BYT8_9BURK|nr:hypothetical protein [Pandoraea bronchicola]VVE89500.1 fatty acid hydroxylase [Pandoraea bronchicola]